MERPPLGARVRAKDRISRFLTGQTRRSNERWERWKRRGDRGSWAKPEPVDGIYVGYRTISDGYMVWVSDEVGSVWVPKEYFEVWLIVPNERGNPIRVFPTDVEVLQV